MDGEGDKGLQGMSTVVVVYPKNIEVLFLM